MILRTGALGCRDRVPDVSSLGIVVMVLGIDTLLRFGYLDPKRAMKCTWASLVITV